MSEFNQKLGNSDFCACFAMKIKLKILVHTCLPIAKIFVPERNLGLWNPEEVAEVLNL